MDGSATIPVPFFVTPILVKLTANGQVILAVRIQDTASHLKLQVQMAKHAPEFVKPSAIKLGKMGKV